ncbi:GAF sensor hybrid histidine kinase [Cyanobacterium aponinum PCC 10605]|uniref:histidine kinase n=2 Tax=Cyanobacterium TaxID=102234 RepID=K9Z8X0_CYAAP|nr:GAF sensor hybrid histidine kinase [Cyanobacterium aponinum PCC 10605]
MGLVKQNSWHKFLLMFISNQSLISIIISHPIFTKISHLWRKLVKENCHGAIYLNEEKLLNTTNIRNKGQKFHSFQLFISEELQCLLIVEKQINELYYQITITLETEEILDFLEISQSELSISNEELTTIKTVLHRKKNHHIIKQNFIFSLLKILTEPLELQESYVNEHYQSQPIEVILRNKIAQERIIRQVTQQIQQDLDPLIIVKMTIEQVQSLLQLDRLLVYQINVPVKGKSENNISFIDTVTYEAKASNVIPSVLNFNEESCFHNNQEFQKKYLEGYTLVIDNIHESNMDICLKMMMEKLEIKAKVAIPIIVKNQLWGLLIAHQCFTIRKWKNSEIKFLKNIAEYLSLAIYQYNSYQKLEEQKNLLEQQIEKKAKQLQDALVVAQIAHQSKTEFLGSISHELRTPLTCIIGLSGTLLHWSKEKKRENLSPEKQVRYLQIIQDSGRKLLQLINNMLDFADLEAGKSLLYIERISLENLSKFVYISGLEIARNQGIKVRLDYQVSPELDLFYADEERLYQILLNLVDNAIKFTPSGGQVIIRVMRNQHQAIFQVEDTGIGIDKKQIPLLFTEFQQLENYRSRSYSGTGLGLALTKHLVELHGGMIEVESIIGSGSTFTVFLPNYEQKNSLKNECNQNVINQSKVNKTIAIICDDEEVGTFLCELLTAADYQVIWLVDVQEAISRINLINPAIVILQQEQDISLTIAESIKSQADYPLYLIVIKDQIQGNEWENLVSSGIDEYLLKPLQPRIFLKKINQVINQHCCLED